MTVLEPILATYHLSFWGIWLILFTVLVQSTVATAAHRKQAKYIPGMLDERLGHESFVFRSHRTFHNSLENTLLMFAPTLLAILVGVNPTWLAIWVWLYAIARIIHMVLYYVIATERNPSPRSYFFMLGFVCNIAVFILVAMRLI